MKWNKLVLVFCRLALVVLCWVFLHCLYITYVGMRPFTGKADVAIVLGNTAFKDSLSPWLQGRVDAALALYRNKQVKKIFVSGGIDKEGTHEATEMSKYLVRRQVPAADIIVDDYGQNTYPTAQHFIALNNEHPYQSAVVISSFYHIFRSKYIIRKLGYDDVQSDYSRAFFWADWFATFRDCVGFYKYWLVY